jgi:hypothetical protein
MEAAIGTDRHVTARQRHAWLAPVTGGVRVGAQLLEMEGTWEQIVEHGPELAGRRVRLIVLAEEPEARPSKPPVFRPGQGPSTARSLLKFAGTWEGDDLEECLKLVYATRSKARF